MPNLIVNEVIVDGDVAQVKAFIKAVTGVDKDGNEHVFDLSKALPVPEGLQNFYEIASFNDDLLAVKCANFFQALKPEYEKHLNSNIENVDEVITHKENVLRALDNHNLCGFFSARDWCVHNWGVEWNPYSIKRDGNKIYFVSPWSYPNEALKTLSMRFPKVILTCCLADEMKPENVLCFKIQAGVHKELNANIISEHQRQTERARLLKIGEDVINKHNSKADVILWVVNQIV